jgi:aliphatic nitrilase
MALITKRKRMMDSVGHYARPDIFSLHVDTSEKRFSDMPKTQACAETDRSQADVPEQRTSDHRPAIVRSASA